MLTLFEVLKRCVKSVKLYGMLAYDFMYGQVTKSLVNVLHKSSIKATVLIIEIFTTSGYISAEFFYIRRKRPTSILYSSAPYAPNKWLCDIYVSHAYLLSLAAKRLHADNHCRLDRIKFSLRITLHKVI